MSDYEFVKGIANLHGFEFGVFYDNDAGLWKANWRAPASDAEKKLTFSYLNKGESTLLDFSPSYGLQAQPSEVRVLFFDELSKSFIEATTGFDEKGKVQLSSEFTGSADTLTDELNDANSLRISMGGIAVDVKSDRPFENLAAAQLWAERFFRNKKDNFIIGEGSISGTPKIKAGDIHTLEGIGNQLSGDWEFTTVRHMFSAESTSGYETKFFANKVVS